MDKKILVVDDEKIIVKGIKFSLTQDGYTIDTAYDGQEALNKIEINKYDLVILDLMLPKIDGIEVCKKVRTFSTVPIIMLTAKGEDLDKILGLEFGADDYMTKPFNIMELKARIKAIIRRNSYKQKEEKAINITINGLEIRRDSRRVFVNEKEVNLTAKEFDLLDLLVSNPNKVYSRKELMTRIWEYDYLGDDRTVDVHVRRLREKIENNPSQPKYVYTKWGVGYYYQA